MAQIIPFPADAEEPELEALSREELLALAQELREKLAELDAREPEDMMSKAYERWGERHEALEDELDDLLDLLDGSTVKRGCLKLRGKDSEELQALQPVIRFPFLSKFFRRACSVGMITQIIGTIWTNTMITPVMPIVSVPRFITNSIGSTDSGSRIRPQMNQYRPQTR